MPDFNMPLRFQLPQLGFVARLPFAVSRWLFLRLDLPGPSPSDKPFTLLLCLLLFHLQLLLVWLYAGDGVFVLVGEVSAVEGLGQLLNEHLRNGPLEFLLL